MGSMEEWFPFGAKGPKWGSKQAFFKDLREVCNSLPDRNLKKAKRILAVEQRGMSGIAYKEWLAQKAMLYKVNRKAKAQAARHAVERELEGKGLKVWKPHGQRRTKRPM